MLLIHECECNELLKSKHGHLISVLHHYIFNKRCFINEITAFVSKNPTRQVGIHAKECINKEHDVPTQYVET